MSSLLRCLFLFTVSIVIFESSAFADEETNCKKSGNQLLELAGKMDKEFKKTKLADPLLEKYGSQAKYLRDNIDRRMRNFPKEKNVCEYFKNEAGRVLEEIIYAKCKPLTQVSALTSEINVEFEETKKLSPNIEKLKVDLENELQILEANAKQYPECKDKLRVAYLIEGDLANIPFKKAKKKNNSEVISYDDWFTMVNSQIKNGKKYSFEACVVGNRNATAIRCNIPGSAAKRVFYNTDDIKDVETKQRWINAINEKKCVTAYVTGGEAFITDIQDSCN